MSIRLILILISLALPGFFYCENRDSLTIAKLLTEAREYFGKNPQEGNRIAFTALEKAKAINHNYLIAKSYNTIGSCLYYIGNVDSSTFYHELALEIQKGINDYEGVGRSYTNIGISLMDNGNNKKAVEYFLEAEKVFLKVNYELGLGKIYNNLGVLFYNMRDFENGIINYQKSLKLATKQKDSLLTYSILTNIASCYSALHKHNMALEKYLEAKKIAFKMRNYVDVVLINNNITDTYLKTDDFNAAIKLNNESLKICNEMGLENYHRVSIYEYFGSIYVQQDKNETAGKYADSAINIAQRIRLINRLPQLYELKIKTLLAGNNKEEARWYLSAFVSLKDSLYESQMKAQVNEINTKYEVEKKENKIASYQTEQQYQKKVKVLLYGIIAIVVFLMLFFIYSFYQKSKDNKIIRKQKIMVEEKSALIEEKQKEILDSINYAKRIQYTLLAHHDFLIKSLPNHFVLFQPKDIVSGDFYWATSVNSPAGKRFYLAVCDSTGHGVPGAFMSLLNISFLNEAITERNILEPNLIFNYVRKRLIESISQYEQKDGFDGILICLEIDSNKITYAAANNAPILIRDNRILQLENDRMPVGKGERMEEFKLYTISPEANDLLYLYTDGYADQFGGPKGKKFKYKALNDLILSVADKTLIDQQSVLTNAFAEWKGKLEQVDDVCIIGIRL